MKPIKRHGGKHYLAKWIVSHFPPRCQNPNSPAADDPGYVHYVEPYFGGGAVLFANDPDGISEVVNDLDCDLSTFWSALKDDHEFAVFQRIVESTPCSQVEFDNAKFIIEHCLKRQREFAGHYSHSRPASAAAFFIVNRQSRQALGKDFATLSRNRTRRGMNELPSAWLSAIEGLPEVHERLKRVVILNDDAIKVIRQQDGPRSLFYCDPPYVHETREAKDAYQHEMTVKQHAELLYTLSKIKGRFLLSGYRCAMYDQFAEDHLWRRVEKKIDNKASGSKTKKINVECLWMNY